MRTKPNYSKILMELSWGREVKWDKSLGTVNLTRLSRKLRIRPVLLISYLQELKALGYLTHLHINYKTIQLKLRVPEWNKPAVTISQW